MMNFHRQARSFVGLTLVFQSKRYRHLVLLLQPLQVAIALPRYLSRCFSRAKFRSLLEELNYPIDGRDSCCEDLRSKLPSIHLSRSSQSRLSEAGSFRPQPLILH
jgi:hypothetical protein